MSELMELRQGDTPSRSSHADPASINETITLHVDERVLWKMEKETLDFQPILQGYLWTLAKASRVFLAHWEIGSQTILKCFAAQVED